MILVERSTEPKELRVTRLEKLTELARIAQTRSPRSEEIDGYRAPAIATTLWRAQRFKCCYCEHKIPCSYNDVEHYRPKTSADRRPGSAATHGYWWLAFTWTNLLYACPLCNRSKKSDLFPLDAGSVALVMHKSPPGKEKALLIDPAAHHGVEHIEFVFSIIPPRRPWPGTPTGWETLQHWWPRARGGSKNGDWTIRVCGLDSSEHIELYDDHVSKEVRPVVNDLNDALARKKNVAAEFEKAHRLLHPGKPFVGLSYDALRQLVPDKKLVPWKLTWPEPRQVGRLSRRR